MGLDLTGLGAVADFGKEVVSAIKSYLPAQMSEAEEAQAQLAVQKLTQDRDQTITTAQRDIIMSEMAQGDAFTKRARPMLVYMGLAFIALNHVIMPAISWFYMMRTGKLIDLPMLTLPAEFWWSWTGVCSAWVIGRSFEKRGVGNGLAGKIVGAITGSK